MRMYAQSVPEHIGEAVQVKGWVHSRRDHGGLIFIDVRDHTGILQLVIQPATQEAFAAAEQLRDEFVISASGTVKERAPELHNPNVATGTVELVVAELTILNKSEPLPIAIGSEHASGEEMRLRYRYLDLRRAKMQDMLQKRAAYNKVMRTYLEAREFTEVATPILASSSPEGARDFLIPSRVHPGKFYALPQAPQQFKQLLMVGGLARYYQIAACFRDEDPRADRLYGEFYQLDLEMSFVEDGEEVRTMVEPLIISLVQDFAGKQLLNPEVPRLTYQDAMNRYGSDKPDLRYGMELVDVSDVAMACGFGVFANAVKDGGTVKAICVKGAAALSRSQIDHFTDLAKAEGAGGLAYLTYADGEVKSPITKFFTPEELTTIAERMGAQDGDAVFFAADTLTTANKILGALRIAFADHFNLKDPNVIALAWIVDFPFYEFDHKAGKLDFGHNPFSMPKGGLEGLQAEDKVSIVADQYDMVMNGYEICSGAVRNHNPEVMYAAFGTLGYSHEYVDAKFGAMINAFKYGAPPHAGCAFGLDRMFMALVGEDNIREVVAFPKNGSGVDVMMQSPSAVDTAQLKELNIRSTI